MKEKFLIIYQFAYRQIYRCHGKRDRKAIRIVDPRNRKNDQQRVSESCDKRIRFRCKKKAGTHVAVGSLHNLSVAAGWYAKEKKKRRHAYCVRSHFR